MKANNIRSSRLEKSTAPETDFKFTLSIINDIAMNKQKDRKESSKSHLSNKEKS